jgi:hypothetical protein
VDLIQKVLQDASGTKREELRHRIRELDPSDEMTIAIELADDDRLTKILEKEILECK